MKGSDRYETLEFAPDDYFRQASLPEIFPQHPDRPTHLDLGCGDGGFLRQMAAHHPECNFLGVERLLGRVRKVARRALRENLENVRLLRLDSSYAVHWLLPKESFARIHFLFPDPWPKKKHHRRRLFQVDFLRAIHALLQPGGEFLFKTDHPGYFAHALEVLADVSFLDAVDWPADEFFYPDTDFELQWQAEGKTIHALRLRKRT